MNVSVQITASHDMHVDSEIAIRNRWWPLVARLSVLLAAAAGAPDLAFAEPQCDLVWEKARNFGESSGQESRDYVYAKQMCSEKGRSRTAQQSAALGASFAGFGLSFGSGSASVEQLIDKACEFVNNTEKTARINVSKLNQLSADAGESYRACLSLYAKNLKATVALSDTAAQQVLIGLVYNNGPETQVSGIPTHNYDCAVEPRVANATRTSVENVPFPVTIGGGNAGSLNVVCKRTGKISRESGEETWPEASIGFSVSGDPVIFSYSAVTNVSPRDAAVLTSRVNGLEQLLVPIGSIVDWYRPDRGIDVPAGFQICDGSAILDPHSVFSGMNTPDLIDRFTMGVRPSELGSTGGRVDTESAGAHTHTTKFNGYGWGEINYSRGSGHRDQFQMQYVANSAGAHGHGDNRPPFVGVIKIMRIR